MVGNRQSRVNQSSCYDATLGCSCYPQVKAQEKWPHRTKVEHGWDGRDQLQDKVTSESCLEIALDQPCVESKGYWTEVKVYEMFEALHVNLSLVQYPCRHRRCGILLCFEQQTCWQVQRRDCKLTLG